MRLALPRCMQGSVSQRLRVVREQAVEFEDNNGNSGEREDGDDQEQVWSGTSYDMVHGTIWCMVRYGAWYDMVHGTIWCMVRYGAWYDMVHRTIWCMHAVGCGGMIL